MNFRDFELNVARWAEERGIYEHSNALAQALKAVSEMGELADGVIKNDVPAQKDAIGDVMVCLVNTANLLPGRPSLSAATAPHHQDAKAKENPSSYMPAAPTCALVAGHVGGLAHNIALGKNYKAYDHLMNAAFQLVALSTKLNLRFGECLEQAWNEIKDRKGRMVPGGAFVKEEN